MERQEVIDRLVANEVDTIKQSNLSYIDSIVRYGGIQGFDNMTNEDLIESWYETYEEEITIGGDFMCNNCGGGFTRDEIKTDEDGDDYCTSCK